jgi:hypothetical protein
MRRLGGGFCQYPERQSLPERGGSGLPEVWAAMSRGFAEIKEDSDASSVYVWRGRRPGGGGRRPEAGAADGCAGADRARLRVRQLPEVLDGRLEPGKVFDRTVSRDDVPAGYQAMDDRASIKVLVTP